VAQETDVTGHGGRCRPRGDRRHSPAAERGHPESPDRRHRAVAADLRDKQVETVADLQHFVPSLVALNATTAIPTSCRSAACPACCLFRRGAGGLGAVRRRQRHRQRIEALAILL